MAMICREHVNGNLYEAAWYSYGFLPKNTKRNREKRQKLTDKAHRVINAINSRNQFMRYICKNFKGGKDWKLELTYGGEEPSRKTAMSRLSHFHSRMKKAFQKAKKRLEYKFMAVTETHGKDGEPARIHHHLIINHLPRTDMLELIRQCWTFGGVHLERLQEDDNFEDTASYFLKERKPLHQRRWTRSRNLIPPDEPVRTIRKEAEAGVVPPGVTVWESRREENEFGGFGYLCARITNRRAFNAYLKKRDEKYRRFSRGKSPI